MRRSWKYKGNGMATQREVGESGEETKWGKQRKMGIGERKRRDKSQEKINESGKIRKGRQGGTEYRTECER